MTHEKSDKPAKCVWACLPTEWTAHCAVQKKEHTTESNKEQHVCLEIVQATDRVHVQTNI